jgi:4-hydroxy-tetrahydrodipicolinate synthase
MRTPVFTGSCPALVTPFYKSGTINYDAFGKLIDDQVAAGVDAVCVCGTTGEAATMSEEEQYAAIRFCVKKTNRRVKVIAGCGSNNTSTALRLSLQAEDAGADALLHVTPYYNKTSQAGLIRHYETIAKKTALPIILYNVPGRTGLSFTADTYRHLAENEQFNGVKEASGDLSLLSRTRVLCGEDFTVWSGNDDQVVPMMALGAKGVISVACNIIPDIMAELTAQCLSGNYPAAASLQLQYADLFDALFCDVNPIPVKAAMNLLGMNMGTPRLPLCEMSDQGLLKLKAALERAMLL